MELEEVQEREDAAILHWHKIIYEAREGRPELLVEELDSMNSIGSMISGEHSPGLSIAFSMISDLSKALFLLALPNLKPPPDESST